MHYVELALSFTGEVDRYTYRDETLTVDGEDYEASGIMEHTGYQYELENALKETEYTYYMDWFGYIRAYSLPVNVDGDLTLLTDAWYNETRTADEYAVKAWLEDEIQDVDVNERATGGFIDDGASTQNNSWGNLVDFETYTQYTDNAVTNLGRYTMDSDGVLSLASAKTYTYDKAGDISGIKTDYVDLDEADFLSGETDFAGTYNFATVDTGEGYNADTGSVTVQANNSTVFYYVTVKDGEVVSVQSVVGYRNSVDVVDSIVDIQAMYAVATNTNADSDSDPYWVADAIVVETAVPVFNLADDVVLGYNVLNKTVHDYADLESINNTAALEELYVTNVNGYNSFVASSIDTPAFYFNTENEDGESYIIEIDENFADYGIYVALVDRLVDLDDYITALNSERTHLWYTEDTVVYDLEWNRSGTAIEALTVDADGDTLTLETGEYYIIYANKSDIVYAVALDSITEDLYDAIYVDANLGDGYATQAYKDAAQSVYEAWLDTEATSQGWPAAGVTAATEALKEYLDGCDTKSEVDWVVPGYDDSADSFWTKVIKPEIVAAQSVATVKNAEELSGAIADTKVKTIELAANITLNTTVTIPANVTLDGNGYTITSKEDDYSAIILSTGCVLKDVNVESFATAAGWYSNYGVQAYNATGVVIEDVTIAGFDAALCVNGSDVTLKGTITVSDNEFGGIEVSKGVAAGLTNSKLTIEAGTILVHAESDTLTTVWVCYGTTASEAAQGEVVDNAGVLGRPEKVTKENSDVQLQYALA